MASHPEEREYNSVQRTGIILEYLIRYGSLTTREAANLAGCNTRKAYDTLCLLSGVIFLVPEDYIFQQGYRWVYYDAGREKR